MSAYETTRTGSGLMAPVHGIVAMLAAWNDARATRKALSKLSDRELDDIGLTRGDIEFIASHA